MNKYLLLTSALLIIGSPAFAQTPAPLPAPAKPAAPAPVPLPAEAARPSASLDIPQQVNNALNEYQQKNYGRAAKALDLVAGEIRKLKSQALAQFLPAAPKGWTSKDTPDYFGGNIAMAGSSAERIYSSGGEEVTLTITADSALFGSMRKFKGRTAVPMQFLGHDYLFETGDASMPEIVRKNQGTLYVNDNLTVRVEGKQLTDQQAQGFIGLVDLAKLTAEADR